MCVCVCVCGEKKRGGGEGKGVLENLSDCVSESQIWQITLFIPTFLFVESSRKKIVASCIYRVFKSFPFLFMMKTCNDLRKEKEARMKQRIRKKER